MDIHAREGQGCAASMPATEKQPATGHSGTGGGVRKDSLERGDPERTCHQGQGAKGTGPGDAVPSSNGVRIGHEPLAAKKPWKGQMAHKAVGIRV